MLYMGSKKGGNQSMKKIAKEVYEQEINRDREIKVAQLTSVFERVSDTVSADTDIFELMPQIAQGVAEGERIGDQILLKKLVIQTVLTADFNIGTNSAVSNFLIRDVILRDRSQAASVITTDDTNFDYNSLLELSQPIVGALIDQITPINKTGYAVRKDKNFKLSLPLNTPNWTAPGSTPQGVKMYTDTLTFGKGLKLDYTAGVPGVFNLPTNFPYFRLMFGAAAAVTQPNPGVSTCCRFQYVVTAYYTDA